jgi:hypothetical protein
MADRLEPGLPLSRKPGEELAQKVLVAKLGAAFFKSAVDNRAATRLSRKQMWGDSDLLDFTSEKLSQPYADP